MRDSNGKKIKHGDKIKTERGVTLKIVEENNTLYMLNEINGQKSPLEILNIHFYKIEENQ